jgi:hypothetical protein
MDDYIYFSFIDLCEHTLRYPCDIRIERLESIEIAYYYYQREVPQQLADETPIIITNDRRLFLRFRHIFSIEEFGLFCKKITFGESVYAAFQTLVSGQYTCARQSYSRDSYLDEDTGASISMTHDNGWKFDHLAINSSMIRSDIDAKKVTLDDDTLEWVMTLPKKIAQYLIYNHDSSSDDATTDC